MKFFKQKRRHYDVFSSSAFLCMTELLLADRGGDIMAGLIFGMDFAGKHHILTSLHITTLNRGEKGFTDVKCVVKHSTLAVRI